MNDHSSRLLTAALLGAVFCPLSSAQDATGTRFADPVRLQAGAKMLGKGRLYPSPATHDLNGDGRFDILIGDLRGKITFALQQADGTFGDEQKLQDAEGKELDFGNW